MIGRSSTKHAKKLTTCILPVYEDHFNFGKVFRLLQRRKTLFLTRRPYYQNDASRFTLAVRRTGNRNLLS